MIRMATYSIPARGANDDIMTTPATSKVTLVLIDLENLVGGPENIAALFPEVRRLYDAARDDSWMPVVAVSDYAQNLQADFLFAWPKARRLSGTGRDAADRELLAVLEEPVTRRATHIELWSGDGGFARPMRLLREAGKHVTVRARYDSLSPLLRDAATEVFEFIELAGMVPSEPERGANEWSPTHIPVPPGPAR